MNDTTAQISNFQSDSPTLSYAMLTALVGNIAAVVAGVGANRVVAIQCLCGRSFDRYVLFNGSVQLEDRYDGMKQACRSDKEIFIPYRAGTIMEHPELTTADYDKIVDAAHRKSIHKQPNVWLCERSRMPIWDWLYTKYSYLALLCAILAFLPVTFVALFGWLMGTSWKALLAQRVIFILLSTYDGTLLDIRREVSYIQVKHGDASAELRGRFDSLKKRALEVQAPATSGEAQGPSPTASDAIQELATGKVRIHGDALLIPVMGFKPSIEWNAANWWFLLTHFRAPLLIASSSLFIDSQYRWVAAHCFALFTQACMQKQLVSMFCSEAEAYGVVWFRRLPTHTYVEEYADYTTALG